MFDGVFFCLQANGKGLLEGFHFLGGRLLGGLLCLLSLLLSLLRLRLCPRAITDCANPRTDRGALARGRAEAKRQGVSNVKFSEGAAQSLRLRDASFDVVIFSWTL